MSASHQQFPTSNDLHSETNVSGNTHITYHDDMVQVFFKEYDDAFNYLAWALNSKISELSQLRIKTVEKQFSITFTDMQYALLVSNDQTLEQEVKGEAIAPFAEAEVLNIEEKYVPAEPSKATVTPQAITPEAQAVMDADLLLAYQMAAFKVETPEQVAEILLKHEQARKVRAAKEASDLMNAATESWKMNADKESADELLRRKAAREVVELSLERTKEGMAGLTTVEARNRSLEARNRLHFFVHKEKETSEPKLTTSTIYNQIFYSISGNNSL